MSTTAGESGIVRTSGFSLPSWTSYGQVVQAMKDRMRHGKMAQERIFHTGRRCKGPCGRRCTFTLLCLGWSFGWSRRASNGTNRRLRSASSRNTQSRRLRRKRRRKTCGERQYVQNSELVRNFYHRARICLVRARYESLSPTRRIFCS